MAGVTLKFELWPRKSIGHLFNANTIFVDHFAAICEFKLLQPRNITLAFDVWPWPFVWTSLLFMVITWWYDERTIVKQGWRTNRQADGRTDGTVHRAAWSQPKYIQAKAVVLWIGIRQNYFDDKMCSVDTIRTLVQIHIWTYIYIYIILKLWCRFA